MSASEHAGNETGKRKRKEETGKRNVYPSWKQRALLTLLCLELVWALGGAGYVRIAYVGYSFAEIPEYSVVGTYVCRFISEHSFIGMHACGQAPPSEKVWQKGLHVGLDHFHVVLLHKIAL